MKTYKQLITELKQENKNLVQSYTELKRVNHNVVNYGMGLEVRYKHIAYCLLRGRSFEQIENKWKDPQNGNNHYCKRKAEELYANYLKQIEVKDETLCSNS